MAGSAENSLASSNLLHRLARVRGIPLVANRTSSNVASSAAAAAASPPWLVATRVARSRAGAIQIDAYQVRLLPLWLSASAADHGRSTTYHPPAYSWPGGGV